MNTKQYDGNKVVSWMEVGWTPRGLVAPKVGKLKLSEAIRRGKPLVNESRDSYRLCALGCAWAGVKGHQMTTEEMCGLLGERGYIGIAKALGYPIDLCAQVNAWHTSSKLSALEIAARLEAQGN